MSCTLGSRIKELRQARDGMSQADLAEKLHVSRGTLANWEIDRANPDLSTIGEIADFFDVSVDYLLGRTDSVARMADAKIPWRTLRPAIHDAIKKERFGGKFAKRLNELMTANGVTEEQMVNTLRLSSEEMRLIENCEITPSIDILMVASDLFGVTTDYLLGVTDWPEPHINAQRSSKIRKVSSMVAIPVITAILPDTTELIRDEDITAYEQVPANKVQDSQYFFLMVDDDRLIGDGIKSGSLALIRYTGMTDIQNDAIYAAIAKGDERSLLYHIRFTGDIYMLYGSNVAESPKYHPTEELEIIGKLVEVRRHFE